MPVVLANFAEVGLPIILAFVGLILGAAIVFFVPFFKKQRDQNKANKIIREAEIKAEHIVKNAQIDGKQTINEMLYPFRVGGNSSCRRYGNERLLYVFVRKI